MIFQVPFTYVVSGKREGNSLNSHAKLWEVAEIEIPSLTGDEAPLAVEWNDESVNDKDSKDDDWGPVLPDGRQHTRILDGQHWSPALQHHVFTHTPSGGAPVSASDFVSVIGSQYCLSPFHQPRQRGRPAIEPNEGFEFVHTSTRNEVLAEIHKAAARLTVIDGMLYRSVPTPVIVVRSNMIKSALNRLSLGHILRIVASQDAKDIGVDDRLFSVQRFAEAMSYANRKNAAGVVGKEQLREMNLSRKPIIYDDWPLEEWPDRAVFVEYAASFIQQFEKLSVAHHSTAELRLYADLRDGVASLPADKGIEMIEDAAAAFVSMHGSNRMTGPCGAIFEKLIEVAEGRPIHPVPTALGHYAP